MQAQAKYLEAVEKFGSMKDRVEGLLSSREDSYLGLLAVPDQGTSSHGSIHGAPVCYDVVSEDSSSPCAYADLSR